MVKGKAAHKNPLPFNLFPFPPLAKVTFARGLLTLHTENHYIVGYCPRYLRSEVFELLWKDPTSVDLRVERVNFPPTPLQFRLLCRITALCKADFRPFSSLEYQPLMEEDIATASVFSPY